MITQTYKICFIEFFLDSLNGYVKVDNKYCTHKVHSTTLKWTYDNLLDATSSCNDLFNCTAIYDYGLGNGLYDLCFRSSEMHNSTADSRLYFKGNNVHIQRIV